VNRGRSEGEAGVVGVLVEKSGAGEHWKMVGLVCSGRWWGWCAVEEGGAGVQWKRVGLVCSGRGWGWCAVEEGGAG